MNDAGNPCPRTNLNSVVGKGYFGPNLEPIYNDQDLRPCHSVDDTFKKFYIDDLTEMEVIKLKKCLVPADPNFA